jgi:hypothetical protein
MKSPLKLRYSFVQLSLGLSFGLACFVSADPVPTIRYQQAALPFPYTGPASFSHRGVDVPGNFVSPKQIAGWRTHDSFRFAKAESIREIRWYGFYFNESDRKLDPTSGSNTKQWELIIWSDQNGSPGTQLYSQTLDFSEVSSEKDGSVHWGGLEHDRYHFSWELAAPLETVAGATYWFSVMSRADTFEPTFTVIAGYRTGDEGGPPSEAATLVPNIMVNTSRQRSLQNNTLYNRDGDQAFTILTVPLDDADEDGMDDEWELANSLDTSLDDSESDPDEDGLSCLEEFERGTDPNLADSDGDGLSDFVETNTGTFLSESDRGSNPNLADTDGDGLQDDLENPAKVYLEGVEAGTDPNLTDSDYDSIPDQEELTKKTNPTLVDSDGDNYLDSWELIHGSDPLDPLDPVGVSTVFPVGGLTTNWKSDAALPASLHQFQGSLDMDDVTFSLWVDFEEKTEGKSEVIFETGGGIIGFSLLYEAGNRLVLRASGGDGFKIAVVERILTAGEIAAGEVEVVWAYDVLNAEGTQTIGLWVDGIYSSEFSEDLGGDWSGNGDANLGKESQDQGSVAGTGFSSSIDAVDFASGTINHATGLTMFHRRYPDVTGIEIKDGDGDGMSDYFERNHGLDKDVNDGDQDLDGDTLSNFDEFTNGTRPDVRDTDGDGYDDNVESKTGFWVSVSDTGTDPLNPDSDGDGLSDGVENPDLDYDAANALVQPGSDPNRPDTDGDEVNDHLEAEWGSDPTDAGDTGDSLALGLMAYWPFDENFEDAANDYHATERGFESIEIIEGKIGGAISLNGEDQFLEVTGGEESDFDFIGGSMTVSTWFKVGAFDTTWQALVAKGEGNSWRMHRLRSENRMSFFGATAEINNTSTNINDGEWHHMVGVAEAGVSSRLYIDGVLVATNGAPAFEDRENRVRIGDNPDTSNREWEGEIDDVAIWNRPLTEAEIQKLWNDGDGRPVLGGSDPKPLGISWLKMGEGEAAGSVEIGWESKDGKTYGVERSHDLVFWEEISDDVEAAGEFTTFVDSNLGDELPRRTYYRIFEME